MQKMHTALFVLGDWLKDGDFCVVFQKKGQ